MIIRKKISSILIIFFILSSCAVSQNYNNLNKLTKNSSCKQAILEVKEEKYNSNASLLYLLDLASVNMFCENYKQSNIYFQRAEYLSKELWTESISKNTLAMVTNDYALAYQGENFEKALINLFSAFNYINMGDKDEALVEVRKLNLLLKEINQTYKDKKDAYKEDAFARYISGILYEDAKLFDDAFIEYFNSYKIFLDYQKFYGTNIPNSLLQSLIKIAKKTHRENETKKLISNVLWQKNKHLSYNKNSSKLVLIFFNGEAPYKIDNKIIASTHAGFVTIAFPEYKVIEPKCNNHKIIISQNNKDMQFDLEMAEDIKKIAVRNLADKKGRIWAKAIARALAKQAAIQQVSKRTNNLVSTGLNFLNTIAIEKADTRSWRTLPAEIKISVLDLEAEQYKLEIKECNKIHNLKNIDLEKGKTKFIIFKGSL